MSLKDQEIDHLCTMIMKRRSNRNKIVVLCEGDPNPIEIHTPQQYSRLENFPDANFYKAAIPSWWRERIPNFYNCGGRSTVLQVYARLLQIHEDLSTESYLDPTKLYAIIDLDNQPCDLSEISSSLNSSEDLHRALHNGNELLAEALAQHRIWITGWVHKESYFFDPDLQDLYNDYKLLFDENPLVLNDLYHRMIDDMDGDQDLAKHCDCAIGRIKLHLLENIAQLSDFKSIWEQGSYDPKRRPSLISALLAIKKAKHYWEEKLTVDPQEISISRSAYLDTVMLQIAKFYADQCPKDDPQDLPRYHIPQMIRCLWRGCE